DRHGSLGGAEHGRRRRGDDGGHEDGGEQQGTDGHFDTSVSALRERSGRSIPPRPEAPATLAFCVALPYPSRTGTRSRPEPARGENVMPKIKHIALATQDVEKTAKFYMDVFGMKEIAKIDSPNASGYYLSDGDLNL